MKRIIKDRHEYFQIRLNSGNEFAEAGNHLSRRVVIDVNNFRIKWIFVPQTKIHARGYKICKRTNIIPHSRKEYRTKILTASQQ